jgi:hypothetical protein
MWQYPYVNHVVLMADLINGIPEIWIREKRSERRPGKETDGQKQWQRCVFGQKLLTYMLNLSFSDGTTY